jgi:superfamily II DNA/RNA helicase
LDMGFMPDIEQLMKLLPKKRQTLMFSATMPKEIRKLAQALLSNPEEITVTSPTRTAETISQYACHVKDEKDKKDRLKNILRESTSEHVIVFCNTKKEATNLGAILKRNNLSVGVLHGDLNQSQRTETLQSFTKGDIKILIASDVAARGLDIETISHVINYDVPASRDDYIHRIGRTGRAGQTGISITFVANDETETWQKIAKLGQDTVLDLEIKKPF